MHGAVTGTADAGWQVAVSIPPLGVLCHGIWDWGQQLALNQILFALAVQQKAAAPVVSVPVAKAPGGDVVVTAAIEKG